MAHIFQLIMFSLPKRFPRAPFANRDMTRARQENFPPHAVA